MIFFFISLSTYLCYLVLKYQKGLALFKKENYAVKSYGKYLVKHPKEIFLTPEILNIIIIVVAINTDVKIAGICMVIFYMIMFLYELRKFDKKIKMDINIVRILIVTLIIYIALSIWFVLDYNALQNDLLIFDHRWIYYVIVILLGYFSYFVIWFGGLFNALIVKLLPKKKRKKRAHKKQK